MKGRFRKLTLLKHRGQKYVHIKFSFLFTEIEEGVKLIPTRKYLSDLGVWQILVNRQSVLPFVDFCNEFDFEVPEEIQDAIYPIALKLDQEEKEKEQRQKENILDSASFDNEIEVEGLQGGTLRTYQKAGVYYIVKNDGRVVLGDDMGLGKTIQAIAANQYYGNPLTVICCPDSVKYGWKNQFNKWIPDLKVSVINAGKEEPDFSGDVIVLNYNGLLKHLPVLIELKPQMVIYDESHYLKSQKAKRTVAAKELAKKAKYRLLLTGTLIVNRPIEMVPQLDILGRLNEFGGYWKFAGRYCQPVNTQYGIQMKGAENLDELHEKLRATCYIRREKKNVLTELPDKVRSRIEIDLTNKKEYQKAEKDVIEYLRSEALKEDSFQKMMDAIDSDVSITELKELYADNIASKAARAEHLVRINTLKTLSTKGKIKGIIEWVEDFLESEEKLIVFGVRKETIKALTDHFKCDYITGEVKSEKRQDAIKRFQTDPKSRLLVINIQAGGTGVDGLQDVCSNELFIEQGWTPAEHDQAEDRLHRMGQKNSVNVYYMTAKDTIDNDIFDLIEQKRIIVNAINKGEIVDQETGILKELITRLLNK